MSPWQAAAPWPSAQVQDTLDRLVARPAYQRDLAVSLGERILRFVVDALGRVLEWGATLVGRPAVVSVALALLLAILLVRLAIELRGEFAGTAPARARRGTARAGDPWAEAERLAAVGRFTDAAHALFSALLGWLGGRGEVRLHPSKTAGDYARELRRRRAPSATAFQRFRQHYDLAVYGGADVSADQYARLREAARPLAGAGPSVGPG